MAPKIILSDIPVVCDVPRVIWTTQKDDMNAQI